MKKPRLKPNQAVYTKKKMKWPECITFWEPILEWDQRDEGKWSMTPVSWCYAVVVNNNVDDCDMEECTTPEDILGIIEGLLEKHDRVLMVGHGAKNLIHLMEFSEYFKIAGFAASCYFAGRERAFIQVERESKSVVICDIRNWLTGSPEEIGKWGGYNCKLPPRFWPEEETFGGHSAQVIFCFLEGWKKYIEWNTENGLGGFAYSMSSLSYNYWTRTKGAENARHPRNRQVADNEKEAFYGGFCYVHRIGHFRDDWYYLLDCNGLYGQVLRDMSLPYRHVTTRRVRKETDLSNALIRGLCIVHGVFSLNSGFLPVRSIRNLDWKHDNVECWLCQPELLWVMEHGKIHNIDTIMVYDGKQLGKEIGDYALSKRFLAKEEGRKYEGKLWKLFITNFFGKMAQRFGSIHVFDALPDEKDGFQQCISATTGKIYSVCIFCGTKIVSIDDCDSGSFVPSVSAFVTSYGRVKLWNLCALAGWENVYYNDTDSLIVNARGYQRLRHLVADDVPGMLSLDEMGTTLEIMGKKQYRLGDKEADNTIPNVFKPSKNGTVEWIEPAYESRMGKEVAGALQVRKAFRQTFDRRMADMREILKDVPF